MAIQERPSAPKVLMLAWEFPPRSVGGVASHVSELSLALAKLGAEVDVITAHVHGYDLPEQLWPPKGEDQPGRLVVYRALPDPISPMDFITSVFQLNFGLLQQHLAGGRSYDLIHAHDWLVAQATWALKQGLKLPLVATIHATEYGRQPGSQGPLQSYINANEWLLTYEAWHVICPSDFMADEVKRLHSVPNDKISVIPNGIEHARLEAPPAEQASLEKFRGRWAAPDEKIVLFVGRMAREKGASVLIEAAPRVLSAWPKAKFILVGGGATGQLQGQVNALGVGNRVTLTGFVPEEELHKLYMVADVAVFPSLNEPFGRVAQEAMALGTPVVTSDVGGLKEVVRHGENALQTWAGDPDSLTWGILEVFNKPEEAAQRARVALAEARENFTWEKVARQTLTVYNKLLEKARQ